MPAQAVRRGEQGGDVTRCQICGRRRGLNKAGGMLFHNVRGSPCLGVGFPPIERTDSRLAELADETAIATRDAARELSELRERRANWIDPALVVRVSTLATLRDRLRRRLDRNRAWPARFARQMEQRGWGDPPPDYLTART
jgi:hypothetical protein